MTERVSMDEPIAVDICVCGGRIEVRGGDVTAGIVAHNLSERHRLWRGDTDPALLGEPEVRLASTSLISAARVLIDPARCMGCGQDVRVIRYGGRCYSLHPNQSVACPGKTGHHRD